MRVAVVSDTHFGDLLSTLVSDRPSGVSQIGPAYPALARAVGKVDYLILLGDIIDFSVASYATAHRHARTFFRRIHADGMAREIIYLPGNHDYDVWHTVEHQVNVINRLQQGQLPRAFKHSVPGVLDDRRRRDKFLLPDVVPHRHALDPEAHYGNLFFDDIVRQSSDRSGPDETLTFNFAYPNLYLVTESGESLLLTHGHYFEAFWSLTGEVASLVAHDDLELEAEDEMSLREMVGINLPLNQLACTGVGQAQPLSQLARKLQNEVSGGKLSTVQKYFDRLEAFVNRSKSLGWPKRTIARLAVKMARRGLMEVLGSVEHAR